MANPNFDNQYALNTQTGEKIYGNDPRVLAVQEQWKAKGVTLNPDVIMGNLGAYGISPANPNPAVPPGGANPTGGPNPQGPQNPTPQPQPQPQYKNPSEEFYARASEMLGQAQNYNGMKDLTDARNALVSAKNASVMAMTPEEIRRFPPQVQDALRNMQTSGIDQQIQAVNSAMQARQNQQAVMKDAYNQAFALAKEFDLTQSKTKDDARAWIQQLVQAGVAPSQDEYQYILDTGSVPTSMMPKLQKAIAAKNLLDQQKADQGTYGFMKDDNGNIIRTNSATGETGIAQQGTGGGGDFSPSSYAAPQQTFDQFLNEQQNAAGQSFGAAKIAQLKDQFNSQQGGQNQAGTLEDYYAQFQRMKGKGGLIAVSTQKAAEQYVQKLIKEGNTAELENYLNEKAVQSFTGAQASDYSVYGNSANAAGRALASIDKIKNYDPGMYETALQRAKPFVGLSKDPTWVDLTARISQVQAQYRNKIFGASLTVNELAEANNFLVDINKDDLGTIQIKLKNMIEYSLGTRDFMAADARGIAPAQRPEGYYEMKAAAPTASDADIYKSLGLPPPNSSLSNGARQPQNSSAQSTGARTDRHNNPTAMTTDVAKTAGLKLGVDYTQGDPFNAGGKTLYTAKLLGDPVATTIKAIDNMGFQTQAGKPRWDYINLSKSQWDAMSYSQKKAVIQKMYGHEGGTQLKSLFA